MNASLILAAAFMLDYIYSNDSCNSSKYPFFYSSYLYWDFQSMFPEKTFNLVHIRDATISTLSPRYDTYWDFKKKPKTNKDRKKSQLAFIKQWMNFEPYNMCTASPCCFSAGLSPFLLSYFFHTGKLKRFRTSDLKHQQFHKFCHSIILDTCGISPCSLHNWISM